MCVIAVSDSNFQELNLSFWQQACLANPHGMGLMWHAEGELRTRAATRYTAKDVLSWLESLPRGCRAALHLREATFGSRCESNLHPHLLRLPGFTLAVMHNGSVPAMRASRDGGPSDSALFVHQWLRQRLAEHPRGWHSAELLKTVDDFLPQRNRLVLLDQVGCWRFVRREEGFDRGRTWLSNPRAKAWLGNLHTSARSSSRP